MFVTVLDKRMKANDEKMIMGKMTSSKIGKVNKLFSKRNKMEKEEICLIFSKK